MEEKIILNFFNKDLTIGSNLKIESLERKEKVIFEFEDLFKKGFIIFSLKKEKLLRMLEVYERDEFKVFCIKESDGDFDFYTRTFKREKDISFFITREYEKIVSFFVIDKKKLKELKKIIEKIEDQFLFFCIKNNYFPLVITNKSFEKFILVTPYLL